MIGKVPCADRSQLTIYVCFQVQRAAELIIDDFVTKDKQRRRPRALVVKGHGCCCCLKLKKSCPWLGVNPGELKISELIYII